MRRPICLERTLPCSLPPASEQNGDEEREDERRTRIVAADPLCLILGGGEPGNYEVEGIGYVSSKWSYGVV